ncbi:hypothetical protein LCGC14_1671580, partial [marine sediment metagenome]
MDNKKWAPDWLEFALVALLILIVTLVIALLLGDLW